VLDEFYRVVFRKKIYGSIAELQVDLDAWVQSDATPLAKEMMIAA
jgi:hypothetical protein